MADDKSTETAVTHLITAVVSGYNAFGIFLGGMPCCFPSPNFGNVVTPKTACGIIFLNSMVGFWNCAVPVLEEQAEQAYETTSYLQEHFVLPIVVSSALYQAGYMPELAYVNMLVPLIPLAAKFMEKEDSLEDIDNYVVAGQCFILAAISTLEENYFGICAAATYATYHYIVKTEKFNCIDIPTAAKMNIVMACFAAFIQKGGIFLKYPDMVQKSWFWSDEKAPCTSNCPMKPTANRSCGFFSKIF